MKPYFRRELRKGVPACEHMSEIDSWMGLTARHTDDMMLCGTEVGRKERETAGGFLNVSGSGGPLNSLLGFTNGAKG